MCNIEIHGYCREIAVELRDRIFELTSEEMSKSEIRVTIFQTEVVDARLGQQPFIRLLSNWDDPVVGLLDMLRSLNESIEHLPLKATYGRQVVEL